VSTAAARRPGRRRDMPWCSLRGEAPGSVAWG
jgi:hypothetical protein